jgi:hypothetical protein
MKDQFEDFVRQNREAFDDKEPSPRVWSRIQHIMGFSKKSVWDSVVLWRAAAIIFMALSVYLLVPKQQESKHQDLALKEFSDVEQFYFEQISQKTELIREFQPVGSAEGLNGFTNDFKQLEAMYNVLKEEMKNRPSRQVKDALVLNLLVRIDLLNQQLNKLEKEPKEEEELPAKNV